MKPRIFISYGHDDPDLPQGIVKVIEKHLSQAGCEPLVDTNLQLGEKWRENLDKWLGHAHGGIVLLSPSSIKSDWVKKEVSYLSVQARNESWYPLVPLFFKVKPEEVLGQLEPQLIKEWQGFVWDCKFSEEDSRNALLAALDKAIEPVKCRFAEDELKTIIGGFALTLPQGEGCERILNACLKHLGCAPKLTRPAEELASALIDPPVGRGSEAQGKALVQVTRTLKPSMCNCRNALAQLMWASWSHNCIDWSAAMALRPLGCEEPEVRTFMVRCKRPLVFIPAHLECVKGTREEITVDRWLRFEPCATAPDGVAEELRLEIKSALMKLLWEEEPDTSDDAIRQRLRDAYARYVLIVDVSEANCRLVDLVSACNAFPEARIVLTCQERLDGTRHVPGVRIVLPELTEKAETEAWRLLVDIHAAGGLGKPTEPKHVFDGSWKATND